MAHIALKSTLTTAAILAFTATSAHAQWTDWLNRDTPDGGLEWELNGGHADDGNLDCPWDAVAIEGRKVSDGSPVDTSILNVSMSVEQGLSCQVFNMPGLQLDCDDYEVRYFCPTIEQINLSGVDERWDPTGMSDEALAYGVTLAQTTSHYGGDAGHIRLNGSGNVKFQESDNGGHVNEDVDLVTFLGSLEYLGIDGESGSFEHAPSSQSDMVQITFSKSYTQPVLFAQVVTHGGWHPIVAVPVEVRSESAVIMMAEPTTYDGSHGTETVHWVVVEAGRYQLDDGRYMLVGVQSVTTDSYNAGGMVSISPYLTDNGGRFADDSTVIAAPQQAPVADYLGTRVVKGTTGTDSLTFSMRHMRRRGVEYASNPDPTEAEIGYMVLGGQSSDLLVIAVPPESTPLLSSTDLVVSEVATLSIEQLGDSCGVADYESTLYSQGDEWGNNVAGADYSMLTGLTDNRYNGGEVWMGAEADANVTLLGDEFTVFDIGIEATMDANDNSSNRVWLQALDGLIDVEEAAQVDFGPISYTQTIFEASAVFYGVTVTGSAVGELGIEMSASLVPAGVTLNGTPYGQITGEGSASVGIWCANANVTAGLNMVRVGLPVDLTLSVNSNNGVTNWTFDSSLDINSLSGSITLGVEWCFDDKDYELFSFAGFTTSYPIYDDSGCL